MRAPVVVEVTTATVLPACVLWQTLADPFSFNEWVAGTKQIRAADRAWPHVGAALHHRWGPWPVRIRDRTVVTRCDPPSRLDLDARARPIAVVEVSIRLADSEDGTLVALRETIVAGLAAHVPRVAAAIQRRRNRRSLDCLVRLTDARLRHDPRAAP